MSKKSLNYLVRSLELHDLKIERMNLGQGGEFLRVISKISGRTLFTVKIDDLFDEAGMRFIDDWEG
jgi:hypothetical protein